MIRDTSCSAYEKVLETIGDRQSTVFQFICTVGVACNTEIAKGLGWPINRVTGRVKELRTFKMVEGAYKDLGESGVDVWYWRVNENIRDWQPKFKNPRKVKNKILVDSNFSTADSYKVQGSLF